MKKFVCLFFALMLFLTLFCGCKNKEEEKKPEELYVSEGDLTECLHIVDSNLDFYNNVFVLGHLAADNKQVKKENGKTYALVTEKYNNLAQLKYALLQTYSEKYADELLKTYDFYKEFDGKLYFDTSAEENFKTDPKMWERDINYQAEIVNKEGYSLILKYNFVHNKSEKKCEFTFSNIGGRYRLEEMINIK